MSSYSAVSAKMRAMYGKCLCRSDFAELLSKRTVGEVCGYLKNSEAYSVVLADVNEHDIHRGEIEVRLTREIDKEYIRLYGFMDDMSRTVLDFWFYRREIDYLKHGIRNIFNKETERPSRISREDFDEFFNTHTDLDTEACRKAETMSDFVKAAAGTRYEQFLRRAETANADYFSIAMGLDGLYYSSLWKMRRRLPKNELGSFERLIGSTIDMLNILWIYRGKRYFKFDSEMIYTYLLPVRYRLSEEMLRMLVNSADCEELFALTAKTCYSELFRNVENGYYADENYRRYQYKISKSVFRSAPYTVAAVFAYLYLKEIEVFDVFRVIEGIRYEMAPEAIQKHIDIIYMD